MEITATSKLVKSSVSKILLVTNLIKKKNIEFAKTQLEFCRKSVSFYIKILLESLINYAENNFGIKSNELIIQEIKVSKAITLKRHRIRARGRIDKNRIYFSKIKIILKKK